MLGRDAKCDSCCEGVSAAYTWETAGRGYKFLCEECYEIHVGLRPYVEELDLDRSYPTYDYDKRMIVQ